MDTAQTYNNVLHEYMLSLRNQKLQGFEPLLAAKDVYECIDLSDNSITSVDTNSSVNRTFYRTRTLLLNNNKIFFIDFRVLHSMFPNLRVLSVAQNSIKSLSYLQNLDALTKLKNFSILFNPVTADPMHRQFIVSQTQCEIVNFKKVAHKEKIASNQSGSVTNSDVQTQPETQTRPVIDKQYLRAQLLNAKTIEEINAIQKLLQSR